MSQLSPADRVEIQDLLIAYASGIDRRDWTSFHRLFTPQCTLDYGDIGTWSSAEEITDYMDRTHAPMGHTLHRITNIAITVDPAEADRATSRCYVSVLLMDAENRHGITAEGYYDDVLRRTAEGWRIAERTFTLACTTGVANTGLAQ